MPTKSEVNLIKPDTEEINTTIPLQAEMIAMGLNYSPLEKLLLTDEDVHSISRSLFPSASDTELTYTMDRIRDITVVKCKVPSWQAELMYMDLGGSHHIAISDWFNVGAGVLANMAQGMSGEYGLIADISNSRVVPVAGIGMRRGSARDYMQSFYEKSGLSQEVVVHPSVLVQTALDTVLTVGKVIFPTQTLKEMATKVKTASNVRDALFALDEHFRPKQEE